jgi:predicted enzyme related to lactoylglutathione lyase
MLKLIEFPVDDPDRARLFWSRVLAVTVDVRDPDAGQGWQGQLGDVMLGLHERGAGPGDRFSLPYFAVADLPGTLIRVKESGGEVIHPGEKWAVCRDSEGSPFGLTQAGSAAAPAESPAPTGT